MKSMSKARQIELKRMEMTNQIYDTLMQNVGMSEFHIPFPLTEIGFSEMFALDGVIHFQHNDLEYTLIVKAKPIKVNRSQA